jgi:hypothetical protein
VQRGIQRTRGGLVNPLGPMHLHHGNPTPKNGSKHGPDDAAKLTYYESTSANKPIMREETRKVMKETENGKANGPRGEGVHLAHAMSLV